jgi:hypothetical protein
MRLKLARKRILIGALLFAVSCGSDDEKPAMGNGGADTGTAGSVTADAGADTSLGSGGGSGRSGSTGSGGAATSGGSAGSGGVAGSGGAAGTGGAVGSGAAGSEGAAGTLPDSGSGGDAALDADQDASDSGSDAGSSDADAGDGCADCWIRDRFPPGRPATITVTGTIRKNDNVCVIVFGGGQCQAQNTPPCNPQGGQSSVTLDLTLDAAGKLTVEAPYQDMCAQDYFCAVSGPGCPIPTSYEVPTDTTFSYVPRATDRCRRDLNGQPYNVSHAVDVRISGRSLIIDQLCTTHMLNLSSQVIDVRDWTTTIVL